MNRTLIAKLNLAHKQVTLVQVESFVVTNARAGRERYEKIKPFFDNLVLIGFVGPRRHFYGDPMIVREVLKQPPFQFHWEDYVIPPDVESEGNLAHQDSARDR